MHPLPEVEAAATQLAALSDETLDLVQRLQNVSALAVALMPSCVGVSITVVADGEPFTVTATSPEMALIDAAQYLADGPCAVASRDGKQLDVDDVLDEDRWQAFAATAAAAGVRSSMSVPLSSSEGTPLGALNLYADEPHAFRDSRERVAQLFGAHVDDLVSNADLAFLTRDFARRLPQQLADRERVREALGVLVARGMGATEARERLEYAAGRAGISLRSAADMVLTLGTA